MSKYKEPPYPYPVSSSPITYDLLEQMSTAARAAVDSIAGLTEMGEERVQIVLVNKTTHYGIHADPIPYNHVHIKEDGSAQPLEREATTDEMLRALEVANMNLAMAQNDVDTIVRVLQMNRLDRKKYEKEPVEARDGYTVWQKETDVFTLRDPKGRRLTQGVGTCYGLEHRDVEFYSKTSAVLWIDGGAHLDVLRRRFQSETINWTLSADQETKD